MKIRDRSMRTIGTILPTTQDNVSKTLSTRQNTLLTDRICIIMIELIDLVNIIWRYLLHNFCRSCIFIKSGEQVKYSIKLQKESFFKRLKPAGFQWNMTSEPT